MNEDALLKLSLVLALTGILMLAVLPAGDSDKGKGFCRGPVSFKGQITEQVIYRGVSRARARMPITLMMYGEARNLTNEQVRIIGKWSENCYIIADEVRLVS